MAALASRKTSETRWIAALRWYISISLRFVEPPLDYIASRPLLALIIPGVLCGVLACAYVLPFGFPAPRVHDEFSYLLGADTFASGRVANPTHPMWVYFESPHIIHVPTYVSMYQPAQALILAAGQRFAGHAWFGVLASVMAMSVASSWMLRAWLPPRWAFVGALVAVQMAVFGVWRDWSSGYWAASYWGGAVAAIGGALVLGALARLRRRLRVLDSLLFALGIAILVNSRPYEGLLLTICAIATLILWVWRKPLPVRELLRKCVLPMAAVLGLTAGAMSYYCWRTTAHPSRLPYQESLRQYIPRRMFIWGQSQPKTYRHAALRRVYEYLLRKDQSYIQKAKGAAGRLVVFYIGPLCVAWVLAWRLVSDRRIRPLFASTCAVILGLACLEWVNIHYAAPVGCALIALTIQCVRHIASIRWRRIPLGRFAALCLITVSFAITSVQAWSNRGWHRFGWPVQRERIQYQLAHAGGKHLVMIRYSDRHNPENEWVYNAANIDQAQVVWAREMADNRPLLNYFSDRKAWLLEPDRSPVQLHLYPDVSHNRER